ncbi:hypothetical protein J7J13_04475 [bacterium]|nr:hypothetical protein [bacterium]
MPQFAIISNKKAVRKHYDLWKWAGEKVIILPETLTEIPEFGGKKRVDFLPLSAPMEEIKEPLSIITDFLIPLSTSCEAIL